MLSRKLHKSRFLHEEIQHKSRFYEIKVHLIRNEQILCIQFFQGGFAYAIISACLPQVSVQATAPYPTFKPSDTGLLLFIYCICDYTIPIKYSTAIATTTTSAEMINP